MNGRWWRAYDEAVDDPKLILLTDRQHRTWFNLCCISSQSGGALPALAVIAIKLRITAEKARHAIAELAALRLIDGVDGKLTMHNWNSRQFKSDVSTDRVREFRKRNADGERNVSSAVSETPPEKTDTEPETEKETPSLRSGGKKSVDLKSCFEGVLDASRAAAVVEHRAKLRKPLTAHGARLLAIEFATCPDPNAAADAMIANGWQGFNADWLARPSARGPPQSGNRSGWTNLAKEFERERNGSEPHENRFQRTDDTAA